MKFAQRRRPCAKHCVLVHSVFNIIISFYAAFPIYFLSITLRKREPEKTTDISRRNDCFPRKMTSEEWVQKFHTEVVSLPRSGYYAYYASDCSWHQGNLLQPIRSTAQIWVVTRAQYGILAIVSDQFRCLGNCPPTPPLSQHQHVLLTWGKCWVRGGVGGQFVRRHFAGNQL